MVKVENLKSDFSLFLVKIQPQILFADVLERRQAFQTIKMSILQSHRSNDFSKGVNPWFKLKN